MSSAPKPPVRQHDHAAHDHVGCCGGHAVNADPDVLAQLKQRLQDISGQKTRDRHESGPSKS